MWREEEEEDREKSGGGGSIGQPLIDRRGKRKGGREEVIPAGHSLCLFHQHSLSVMRSNVSMLIYQKMFVTQILTKGWKCFFFLVLTLSPSKMLSSWEGGD